MFGVSNVTNRMDPNSLRSRLFVGNLNTLQMQKSELEAIFQQYGKIIGLSVHKGYAFIQYTSEMSARTALNCEDGKVYYNMTLDVSLASEPKNRKRGRSYTESLLCDQPNFAELAFQSQAALAAIGGQFSQLGFVPQQQNSHQYRSPAMNLPGIIGAPLLTSASKLPRTSTSNRVSSVSQQRNRTSVIPQPASAAYTAKRTRLENPTSTTSRNKLTVVDSPRRESVSPKSPISVGSSSPNPKSKRLSPSASNESVISDKLSGMTVDNGLDLASSCSESEGSLTPQETSRIRETQLPSSTTTSEQIVPPKPSSSSTQNAEDILICGRCRRLFDNVDDLLSHKTRNSCVIESAKKRGGGSEHSCRCKELGEPESLECFFCNAKLFSSWELLEHCRLAHNLTVYRVPKRSKPDSDPTSAQKPPALTPFFGKGDSNGNGGGCGLNEKPSSSLRSSNSESKCHDDLDKPIEVIEAADSSEIVISILSDDENVDIDSEVRSSE